MSNNQQFSQYNDIPQSKFQFAQRGDFLHDNKIETKPVGYLKDAFRRFAKNKASIVAACIILLLIIFAIIGPYFVTQSYTTAYTTDSPTIQRYRFLLPKLKFMEGTGIWDGTKTSEVSEVDYYKYLGMSQETGLNVVKYISSFKVGEEGEQSTLYKVRLDTYTSLSGLEVNLSSNEFKEMQAWQEANGVQLILPYVNRDKKSTSGPVAEYNDKDVWYQCGQNGVPVFQKDSDGNKIVDENGNYVFIPAYLTKGSDGYNSVRLANDPGNLALERVKDITDQSERTAALNKDSDWTGRWRYAKRSGTVVNGETIISYSVRVCSYYYFQYKFGFEPSFIFGTDANGYDIISRLASGARFSFMLAICVSAINLTIGAIYGAIEGYYGGVTDLVMERTSDILSGIPQTVVTILFQLHLSAKVGVVGALIYAFILTGWIGMAGSVRMQFYRYKNQEYVLAARTLGASDWRIMFKHIFPNSLGTLITGSVLVIPGVIFSETSLTYLGIVNLEGTTMTSVGSMLSAGQGSMTYFPHVVLFPAIFIALLMICFNLFGNGLRDAFNPSLRGTEG